MKTAKLETQVVYCGRSWVTFVIPGFLSFLFLTSALVGFSEKDPASGILALVVTSLVVLFWIVIPYKTTYLKLTDKRLIGHRGFIFSTRVSVTVDKIQDIRISNGLLGKVFKYHTITIDTASSGQSKYVFKKMANAVLLCDTIHGLYD